MRSEPSKRKEQRQTGCKKPKECRETGFATLKECMKYKRETHAATAVASARDESSPVC